MISRTAGTNSLHTVASGRVMTAIAVVILFTAILLLGVRYAHGGAEVSSGAAANTESMTADGGRWRGRHHRNIGDGHHDRRVVHASARPVNVAMTARQLFGGMIIIAATA